MSRFLRQATAANLMVGPFVDDADGKTAETGLTLTPALSLLSKNGSDPTAKNEGTNAVHKSNGFYLVTVDTTDTNTIGRLRLSILGSGALPVWEDYVVLDEAVYDAFFGTVALALLGDIMKVSSGTGANQISLSAGVAAASVAAGAGVDAAAVKALMDTTAIAELTGDPGATPGGILKALMLLYMKSRNAETVTATAKTVKNSAGTTLLNHTLSDDGTTFTKGKLA